MQKRIYIETTIPSFYYTLRTDEESLVKQRATRRWWDEYTDQLILTSSTAVVAELRRGRSGAVQARLDLLEGVELFESNSEIDQITQIYIESLVMPQDPVGDAFHLAITSFYKVDALLTWNLAHLANPNKLDFITEINQELGLPTPELVTPLDYLGGTDSNGTKISRNKRSC